MRVVLTWTESREYEAEIDVPNDEFTDANSIDGGLRHAYEWLCKQAAIAWLREQCGSGSGNAEGWWSEVLRQGVEIKLVEVEHRELLSVDLP